MTHTEIIPYPMIFLNQFYMSKICQIKKAGSQPLQLTTHSIPLFFYRF